MALSLCASAAFAQATCPAPEQLQQRLVELGAPVEHLRSVTVRRTERGAEVFASRDDGSELTRALGEGDCPALTDAAAVIVLAWLTRLDEPAQNVEPPVPPTLAAEAPPVTPAAPPPAGWALATGAGASLWWGGSATWGAEGYVAFSPRGWLLQPELIVFGQGQREIGIAFGHGVWSRLTFVPGLSASAGSTVALRAEAGLAAGILWVGGEGFDQNQSNVSWDLGARVGLRVSYAPWALRPFLGAALTFWAVGHRLDLIPLGMTSTLPWVDVQLTAGIELGR